MNKHALRAFALPAALAAAFSLVALPAASASAETPPLPAAESTLDEAATGLGIDDGSIPEATEDLTSVFLPDDTSALEATPTDTAGPADVPPALPETPQPAPWKLAPVDASATSDAPSSSYSDSYARQVFDLMNVKRRAAGLSALRWNQSVANVSQEWANHLGDATRSSSFDWGTIHRADGGGSSIPRGATWYGEIIAFNFTPQSIVDWWMGSPSHKAAMLDGRETDAGVGYVVPSSGPYAGWHLVVSNLAGYPGAAPASSPAAPVSTGPFSDLLPAQLFYKEMIWTNTKKISTGWLEANGKRTYRALQGTTRDAMAAFLYRLAGSPKYTPPAKSPFADVSTDQQFYKEMAWLASKKISTGWVDGSGKRTFRPLQPVDRQTMAAFLYRFSGSPKYTAPVKSPFSDVSTKQAFYKEMSWLAAKKISTGWTEANGKRTFRPSDDVARDAMAAFMYRLKA
ncbi:MAG: peptidase and in, kexin, sedolisin [Micrococcaceae bacterium]|nr:peptidase and in, kexin, sedolisin [Micrococcaceae bacterium]